MKRLTLVRHAKSSWDDSNLEDRDRPLSERGERDAPYMGGRLRARKARPSLIVSSPATRALQTARIIAAELGYPAEFLQIEHALYLAGVSELRHVIGAQDERCADLMVVGHNPGLTELANALMGEPWIDNLPTGGVVAIDFDTTRWTALSSRDATLAYVDYPKNPEVIIVD